MRLLLLSRDVTGLDPASASGARWRLLRDPSWSLDFIISSPREKGWSEEGIRVLGSGGRFFLSRLWRVYCLSKKIVSPCDGIVAQDPFELGFLAYVLARRTGKRFEVQDHGGFFDGKRPDEPLWRFRSLLATWIMRRASAIRTVSPGSFEKLKQRGFGKKTYFLPIGADERFWFIERMIDSDLIVSVGRLVPVKRHDILIRAFAELRKKRPTSKLIIIGDGPLRPVLENLIQDYGLGGSVQLVGTADPAPFLSRARVFVLCSSHEGWGIAAVEAAMAGVPVVMSDTGAARFLEEHRLGTVVATNNPSDFVAAIERVMETPLYENKHELNGLALQETALKQKEEWHKVFFRHLRLLICVQAVDLDDPLMGFFHGWLEEASKQFDRLIVLALRVGRFSLPQNIEVLALRPKGSRSRMRVVWTLWKESWRRRFDYDAVFVRGDSYYIIFSAWLWRFLSKRIGFWYAHYRVSIYALIASAFAHFTTASVKASYNHPLVKPRFIGQNIDHHRFPFSVRGRTSTDPWRCLSFSRVMRSKHIEDVIDGFIQSGGEAVGTLTIIGPRLDRDYADALTRRMKNHPAIHWGDEHVLYDRVPKMLSEFDVLMNAYPGSLDKTIIESALTGLIPIAATDGMCEWLPEDLWWLRAKTAQDQACALRKIFSLSEEDRLSMTERIRAVAIQHHSLESQMKKLYALFSIL